MTVYTKLFMAYFSWFRGWSSSVQSAAGATCVLLLFLHVLNAIVFLEFRRRTTGGTFAPYDWIMRHPLLWLGGCLVYVWYFVRKLTELEKSQSDLRVSRRLHAVAGTYLGATVVGIALAVML